MDIFETSQHSKVSEVEKNYMFEISQKVHVLAMKLIAEIALAIFSQRVLLPRF